MSGTYPPSTPTPTSTELLPVTPIVDDVLPATGWDPAGLLWLGVALFAIGFVCALAAWLWRDRRQTDRERRRYDEARARRIAAEVIADERAAEAQTDETPLGGAKFSYGDALLANRGSNGSMGTANLYWPKPPKGSIPMSDGVEILRAPNGELHQITYRDGVPVRTEVL